jgi:lipopolysaccharide heptosyltransferase II
LWCPFFGRLASTSTLAATLALRTRAQVVPAAVYTVGVARWRCVLFPPIPTESTAAEALTLQINAALEQQIREQPADWFWVHNRWKTPKPKFLLATYKRGVVQEETATASLQPFRIAIRASNWLGDAVMSVPAVQAIRRGRPDARVTIVTPEKLADFWRQVQEVDEVIPISPEENVFAVGRKLRASNFDVAILFPNSLRVALEIWLAGIPRRVGYPGHHRRALLDPVFVGKKKKTPARPKHQVHHYLELARFIGAAADDLIRRPPVDEQRPLRAAGRLVLGLCPGAEYGPAKRWLPEGFAEVMRRIHEATGCEWKLFGVGKDREVGDVILTTAAIPATDLIGKTSLAELIAELRTCDLLLTNDTGTMHLAAFLGVRTISLFGSTEPALTGPLGTSHRILRHHVECSPCFLRECPIDFRCMKAITTEEVTRAVLEALPPPVRLQP